MQVLFLGGTYTGLAHVSQSLLLGYSFAGLVGVTQVRFAGFYSGVHNPTLRVFEGIFCIPVLSI